MDDKVIVIRSCFIALRYMPRMRLEINWGKTELFHYASELRFSAIL